MNKANDWLINSLNRLYLVGTQLGKSIQAYEAELHGSKSKQYRTCVDRKWLLKILYKDLAVTYRALANDDDTQSLSKVISFLQTNHTECQYLDRIKEQQDDKTRTLRKYLKKLKKDLICEKVIVENWINSEITHFGKPRQKDLQPPMGGNVWNAAKMAFDVLFAVDYLVTGRKKPSIRCPLT